MIAADGDLIRMVRARLPKGPPTADGYYAGSPNQVWNRTRISYLYRGVLPDERETDGRDCDRYNRYWTNRMVSEERESDRITG
jgi:hypothetical protein